MKRCLSIIMLMLLFATLTACTVTGEDTPETTQFIEQSEELTYIKTQWQRYVIDRTEQVAQVQLTLGLADSHMGLKTDLENINAVLDVCKTLDISKLRLLDEGEQPEISLYGDFRVIICGEDPKSGLTIQLTKDGVVYISDLSNENQRWVYTDGWTVHDLLYLIKYSEYFK